MRSLSILLCVLLLSCASLPMMSQRTTRKPLRPRSMEVVDTSVVPFDTVWHPGEAVLLSGYEKPLRSLRETVHVSNLDSVRSIRALIVSASYLDVDSAQVHKRDVEIQCDIPAGETRMVVFRSWDIQNRFYYIDGPKPRTQSSAYPFSVRMDVAGVVYSRD